MSEHVWAQENIAAYVAGGLDAAEGERLEKHLADCPTCARWVDEARSLEKKLAPLVLAADPGPFLEDRIIRSFPPMQERPRMNPLTGKRKTLLAAAAALLLAVLGAGVSTLIEKHNLGYPAAPSVRMAQAVNGERKDLTDLHDDSISPVAKSEKTGVKQLYGMDPLSSASDLATGSPEKMLAPLKQEESKLKENLGRSYEGITFADEKALAKASLSTLTAGVPPPPSPVSTGGSSKVLESLTYAPPQGGPNSGKASSSPAWADFDYTFRSTGPNTDKEDKGKVLVWNYTSNGTLPNLGVNFFKPGDDQARQAGDKDIKETVKDLKENSKQEVTQVPIQAPALPTTPAKPGADAQKTDQAPAPPPEPRRIIIRTGDLEFEIDSFDASVATILKLVNGAKGSFVATINSDKLPNGKVRGAVVVRVPPELLDNFVLDLRKDLSKNGELKNQRIGSLDITKQYTDLESRLRAARAMEERLLAIIKDGKGQIKDLLAAEKELGNWRTQIEGLEGDLRFHGNLAAFSTLTIKLYERNIRTAASVTESERVQAGLEVEDVEKAHQEALKAIYDAKGRVTRSELKQHAAGQFNAVLHFEVGHEAAGPIRDRLKQLGTMVRLQVDRLQQTEDGSPAPKDGKIERGPTLFLVSIYNLANVAPRETVILRLAAADVPAVFNKLRGVITVAKGHVINAQLDEKDRKNITAQLDCHVSRLGEGDVLAALLGAGETLTRQVNRVPENDNVTDAKVLYRITLVDADSIQPRETVVLRIAAADVPAAYQKLREALDKAKARVFNAQLNEQERSNVNAQLDFSLRRGDEAVLQAALTGAGETLSRRATRLPESPNLTDDKVLFQVALIDVDVVQPRETVVMQIVATDVPAAYEKLRGAVVQSKGRILTAQLNEQDRRDITAKLDVTVNRGDAKAFDATLAAAGETLNRRANRTAEAANVTDAKMRFVIDVLPAAAIAPRETTTLSMEVTDVAAALTLLKAQVKEAQGRFVDTQGQERNGQVIARVTVDVPLNATAALADKFKNAGQVRGYQVTRDPQAPEGKLAIGRLVVTLSNTPLLVPADQDLWSQLRRGLAISLNGLSISASWLIVGLLFVLPWLLFLYAAVWLARRLWRGDSGKSAIPATSAGNIPPASNP